MLNAGSKLKIIQKASISGISRAEGMNAREQTRGKNAILKYVIISIAITPDFILSLIKGLVWTLSNKPLKT